MEIITIYKIKRVSGGTTVTLNKPEGEYTEMYRLIADEGKILKKGEYETPCVDVASSDGWEEIDKPEEITAEEALAIIMGMGGTEG